MLQSVRNFIFNEFLKENFLLSIAEQTKMLMTTIELGNKEINT